MFCSAVRCYTYRNLCYQLDQCIWVIDGTGTASLFRGPPCFAVFEARIFPPKIRETLTITFSIVGTTSLIMMTTAVHYSNSGAADPLQEVQHSPRGIAYGFQFHHVMVIEHLSSLPLVDRAG